MGMSPSVPSGAYGPPPMAMDHPGKHTIQLEITLTRLRMPPTPAPRWLNQTDLDKLTNDVNRLIQETLPGGCLMAMVFLPCTVCCVLPHMVNCSADIEDGIRRLCARWSNDQRRAYFFKQKCFKN